MGHTGSCQPANHRLLPTATHVLTGHSLFFICRPNPTPPLPPACSEYCEEDIEELCKDQREAIEMAEGFGADAQVISCLEVGRCLGLVASAMRACGMGAALPARLLRSPSLVRAVRAPAPGGKCTDSPEPLLRACPQNTPAPQTQRDKIRSRRCRDEVKRQMRHEAEDIRFDHALATACHKCGGGSEPASWHLP